MPLRSLSQWLRGLKGDGQNDQYDAYGLLMSLNYTDDLGIAWRADFIKYRQIDNNELPVKLNIEGGGYLIKLNIDSWVLDEEQPKIKHQRLSIPGIS